MRNEDSEFSHRLLEAGERLRYEPTAVVYHEVPQNRLHKKFFLRWWFDKGRAEVRASDGKIGTTWVITGIPPVLLRRIAVGTLRWLLTVNTPKRFTYKLTVWLLVGRATESYRLRKKAACGTKNLMKA
jgi:hypothetical protein